MRYKVLAVDYDGTLAQDGVVDAPTVAALHRLLASGRKLVLVTGREVPDLRAIFDRIDLFTRVVAENGALLVDPATGAERTLADPPSPELAELLRARGVSPLSVGRVIVATREPHQDEVLSAIHHLGLDLEVILNKGAVMILPSGTDKGTGFRSALRELGYNEREAVGVGDAENDHAFLTLCGLSIAVANALPALKESADLVTAGARGAGVAEVIDRLVREDLAGVEPRSGRLPRRG